MSMTVARILLMYRKMHVYFAFGCYAQRAMNTTWTPLLLKMGVFLYHSKSDKQRGLFAVWCLREIFLTTGIICALTPIFNGKYTIWWRCYESQFMVDDNVSFGHDEIYLVYTNCDHKLSTPKLSSNFIY